MFCHGRNVPTLGTPPSRERLAVVASDVSRALNVEVNVRKLIITAVSVLALGIGWAGARAADTSNTGPNVGSNMPAMSGNSPSSQSAMKPTNDEVRQIQQRLRDDGLYHGQIDGNLGPETKQALAKFQKKNGLNQTATLDQPTMDKLLGNMGGGQGSSTPPGVDHGTGSTVNPQPGTSGSGLGDHNMPKQ